MNNGNNWRGCTKRFTQSSNLSAHEKIHMTKEGSVKSGKGENVNNLLDFE